MPICFLKRNRTPFVAVREVCYLPDVEMFARNVIRGTQARRVRLARLSQSVYMAVGNSESGPMTRTVSVHATVNSQAIDITGDLLGITGDLLGITGSFLG